MQTVHWPIIRRAVAHPKRIAVVDDQRQWRFIDLIGGALHLAERIEAVSGSRHVGILLPTSGACPMAMIAAWILGRTVVPINFLLSDDERQFIVDDSEVDTVITAGPMLEHLKWQPDNVNLIELDEVDFKKSLPFRWPAIASANDLAAILYTSGTTGRPKGVMLTHRNLRSNVDAIVRHADIDASSGFLGVLPQFHSFGLTALTLVPLSVGAKVVYTARFVPKRVVELIREHRPNIFIGIPSMYSALLSTKSSESDDFQSIDYAVSGGAPLPRSVFDRFEERFHVKILEGYGLTETSPAVSWSVPSSWKPGAVGRVLPKVDVKIVDEEGRELPRGEAGEILVRGPLIMAGYFKQPRETSAVIDDDGYFHSGDWGKLDEDGFLYITGRKKEMLIIGGENVFPREIEEVLNKHETIKDSAVVGVADDVRGEVPIAFVEVQDGRSLDEKEVRAFCRRHLAPFKVPREIRVLDALPRNPTGKILRRELPV